MTRTILVAGGTGALGRHIVSTLRTRGFRVRVLTRQRPEHLKSLPSATAPDADIEFRHADALDPRGLAGTCDGIDAVISALGASVLPSPTRGWARYSQVDTPANLNLANEASRAGVKRFVYVSLFGAEQLRGLDYVDAHEAVVDRLRASATLSPLIVRPTGFFSAFSSFIDMARSGAVYGFGDGTAHSNPIHDEDIARACVDGLDAPAGERPIGGPDVLTRRAMSELAIAAVGKRAAIRNLPLPMARTISWLSRPFLPRVSHILAFYAAIAKLDLVAPVVGTQRLADYFRICAKR